MQKLFKNLTKAIVLSIILCATVNLQFSQAQLAHNPTIWADVPDAAIVRVGDTYYMSSTTMHVNPGVPIMKSKDLVNWELIGYAYDTLVDNEKTRLENGQNAYGAGSWASSLRYHKGTFYVSTFSSTSGKTHVYTTTDIEKGNWKAISFSPMLHDHSLFFDDDGRVYMLYDGGTIRIVELNPDVTGIKPGGINQVIVPDAGKVAAEKLMLHAEGSQLIKHNGKYYLFNITWPMNDMRTVIVHRADKITGPYEGRVALHDRGIAQGSIIDSPEGNWYAYMFRDFGAVGRIPYLMPVTWEDGWPVLGIYGKCPDTLNIPAGKQGISGISNLVTSDNFERKAGEPALPLAWQWNHNPVNELWSLNARPGYLRLTTGRVDNNVLQARNTLTQRTYGPECTAEIAVDVSNMKDGDVAGLIALQKRYGYVGIKMENGKKSVVMVSAETESPVELESLPLEQNTVYFKIECDFNNRTDKAYFFYSLNGTSWNSIGKRLQMAYTLPHFMGYRFGLFNYATQTTGGFVDFDYYKTTDKLTPGLVSAPAGN